MQNEIGDLIEAFNRMVASIAEQRSGLNDTLSLLDSMLANAPIGLAFFDRGCRFIRVNQVFADMTGVSLSRHLGRTLPELLPQPAAQHLEDAVLRVFAEQEADAQLRNQRPDAANSARPGPGWSAPIPSAPPPSRFAGPASSSSTPATASAVKKPSARAEKLAVTGRLAASIAHEINNPLEAITNLLFLLRNYCAPAGPRPQLRHHGRVRSPAHRRNHPADPPLLSPVHAARARQNGDLLDSVLSLYQGRFNAINMRVERNYDPDLDLFCFAGEIRQVFANLVGNSIDASPAGGRLLVRARRSRNWKNPAQTGVRFTVADTGSGMDPEVRKRAFEAFFTTKEVTGTGLGLWISHEIIAKHRGIIHVRSRTAGSGKTSGTVFQFFIPDDPALFTAPEPAAASVA